MTSDSKASPPIDARVPFLTSRLQGFGTTIFAEMTQAANRHGAINLGQGFPDFDGPDFIKDAAVEAMRAGFNQYAPSAGIPALTQAIAAHQERFWGLTFDAASEVTVYSGATEAIFATIQSLCDVGDEVVLFEPYYDSYRASVAMAGAVERIVTLRAPDFVYDPRALEAALSAKTRAILLNSPHNPSGKVFSRAELAHIARLCCERDLIVIADEVYEHLVFEGEHVPIASLPGMRERTVTISSSGKTFSLTGWKIGWSCAAAPITRALRASHQFITFSTAAPLQHGIAAALAANDAYYETFLAGYRSRRDRLCAGLADVGLSPMVPDGTYFVCADIRPLGFDDDAALCRRLPAEVGVVAIPNSAFYLNKDEGRHLIRFAFCKTDAVLDEGIRRLRENFSRVRRDG